MGSMSIAQQALSFAGSRHPQVPSCTNCPTPSPTVSEKRLSLTAHGQVRYSLKTPWNDGTTHVIFEPLDFMARLAALVPKPRINLTRFHGVFAPNSKYRALITPAQRGKGRKPQASDYPVDRTTAECHVAMTWAQRLKRVFNIDITTCQDCGGAMKVIACIEDPDVIQKILTHLQLNTKATASSPLPEPRASPISDLFDTL